MSRYTVVEHSKGLFILLRHNTQLGFLARGDVILLKDMTPQIRGRHWVILGYEYVRFKTLTDAAEALFKLNRHLADACLEVGVVKRLEGLVPIYKRVSRYSEEKSVKEVSRVALKELKTSKRDYHDSLNHAGISKYIH